MLSMRDDPQRIAEYLVSEHGLDGALAAARDGVMGAQQAGDFYRLSIWREVRRVLRDRPPPPDGAGGPSEPR
jgi:hypothetical protein